MIDYSELYEFITGGNTVHCENRKEANKLLDIISDLGIPIGFDRAEWSDARYFSLGTMPSKRHELHACVNRKFRDDGTQCEFSALMERAEAADVIPEIDELPSLEDLIGFKHIYRVES